MPIDRTWWNNLIDDDGSGMTGTVWNKATIKGLLDAIDGMTEVGKVWTPTLTFGGSAAGWTMTKTAGYARADELVILEATITITAKGSAVGGATISGAPFLPKTGINPVGLIDPAGNLANLSAQPIAVMSGGVIYLMMTAAGSGTRTPLTDANFTATSSFGLMLAYRKA